MVLQKKYHQNLEMNNLPLNQRILTYTLSDLEIDFNRTLIDLLQDSTIDEQILNTIYNYIVPDKEEQSLYEKRFNITNSQQYHFSSYVCNSKSVWNSQKVNDSKYIYDSTNVNSSQVIFNSTNIYNSNEIWNCQDINDSRAIFDSNNIKESNYILHSTLIEKSDHISKSNDITTSDFILNCSTLKNCLFCGTCSNAHHLLFCYDLHEQNYYICNKKVTPTEFSQYYELIYYLLGSDRYNPSFVKINSYIYSDPKQRYKINYDNDSIFDGLSKDFIGQVGARMPNFSEDLFFKIFFPIKCNLKFEKF